MLLEVETVVAPEAAASPSPPPPAEPSSGSEGEAEAGCCASYGEGAMGVECCHTLLDASEDDCTEETRMGGGTKWFTECPVAMPGPPPPACSGENPTFVDEGGFSCDAWEGYDCTTAMEDYGYTAAATAQLVASCPICCAGSSAIAAAPAPPVAPMIDLTDAGLILAAEIMGAIIAVPIAVCCLIAIGCGIYVCYKRRKSRVPSGYGRPVTGAALPASAYGGKSEGKLIVGQTAASKI